MPTAGELFDEWQREQRLTGAASHWSRVRENMVEHVFIAELLQEAWFVREQRIEVLRAEVDAFGYDLVLECNDIVRHLGRPGPPAGVGRSRSCQSFVT
jgi:hypothetical protein